MRVGTKLTLFVVIPTCGLVVFASLSAIDHWREADRLREFRTDTRLAPALAGVAEAVANERSAVVAGRLGVRADRRRIAAARRAVDAGLRRAAALGARRACAGRRRGQAAYRAADSTRCAGRRPADRWSSPTGRSLTVRRAPALVAQALEHAREANGAVARDPPDGPHEGRPARGRGHARLAAAADGRNPRVGRAAALRGRGDRLLQRPRR
jgi:hypothetical protein